MPLFVCEQCGTIDNTALTSGYWSAAVKLCTVCAGEPWHGRFPQVQYNPVRDRQRVFGPLASKGG